MSKLKESLEKITNGLTNEEIKKINLAYRGMLSRCYNKNRDCYKNYGGRGISVCQEWLDSKHKFIEWSVLNGHKMNLSLDRIDNDLDYSPENCRWADDKTQLRNQRRARLIEFNGVIRNISEWAEILGINADTLHRRIDVYKMPIEKAMKSGRINEWKHGTRHGYEKYKCRCELCKEAHNSHHRKRRLRRKNETKTRQNHY